MILSIFVPMLNFSVIVTPDIIHKVFYSKDKFLLDRSLNRNKKDEKHYGKGQKKFNSLVLGVH